MLLVTPATTAVCKFPTSSDEEEEKTFKTPLCSGERLVQPREARNEEAKGSRRNPSDNDPQVTSRQISIRKHEVTYTSRVG